MSEVQRGLLMMAVGLVAGYLLGRGQHGRHCGCAECRRGRWLAGQKVV